MGPDRLCVKIEKQLSTFRLSISLDLQNEIVVLFGPSGAGKTQTLNAIAGLVTPDAGEITLGDTTFFRRGGMEEAVNLPARKRRIGFVFQNYALFPHLTAAENIAYSLWRKPEARGRALELLERMHLTALANRYPHQLSGGQQQRVAIARALAAGAKVLLMDEPFSALDHAIRERLHHDLRNLRAESELIVIYVTHNLDDALAVGHRLALISDGCIEQIGTPSDVLRNPVSRTGLKILGVRNVFDAKVTARTEQGLLLDWQGLRLETSLQEAAADELVAAYIRPEAINLISPPESIGSQNLTNVIKGTIAGHQIGAHHQTIRIRLANGHEIEAHRPAFASDLSLRNGDWMLIGLPKDSIRVLPSRSTKSAPEAKELGGAL